MLSRLRLLVVAAHVAATALYGQDRIPAGPLPQLQAHLRSLKALRKGTYESSADFHARAGRVVRPNRTLWAEVKEDWCTSVKYDADASRWIVELDQDEIESASVAPLHVNEGTALVCTARSLGSYTGSNAFGATRTIRRQSVSGAGVTSAYTPMSTWRFEAPMSRDSARALRGALRFVARVVIDTADGGAFLGLRDESHSPTIDDPVDREGRIAYAVARSAELLLVHAPSRRILWRVPLIQPLDP